MSATGSSARDVAGRMKNIRLLRGLTQRDVAVGAGLSLSTYQRFEREGLLGLDRFVRVCEVLGLGHQFAALGTPDASVLSVVAAGRQRGRRHAVAAPKPAAGRAAAGPAAAGSAAANPAVTAPSTAGASVGTPATPTDAAAVERTLAKNRTTITWLIRAIVSNRLTNFTAGGVCRTMLKKFDMATRAEIVAAVEAILRGLNPDTASEYGLSASELAAWQPTWKPDVAIAHPLE
jgi:DNA-binding XRE family transcriptional regulator